MENQNRDIATTCVQNIVNLTDIDIFLDDESMEMLVSVIESTVKGVREKQHAATKAKCCFNDEIDMPDLVF